MSKVGQTIWNLVTMTAGVTTRITISDRLVEPAIKRWRSGSSDTQEKALDEVGGVGGGGLTTVSGEGKQSTTSS
jgi:hypothetical protein